MNDLISRKALLAEYDRVHVGEPGRARKLIEDAPTVDAEPVRHGQNVSPTHYSDGFTCSACGFSCEITELRYDDEDGFGMGAADAYEYDCKFCPDCGAKMDGGAE